MKFQNLLIFSFQITINNHYYDIIGSAVSNFFWIKYLFHRYFGLIIPAGNYMFRVDNRNTRTTCELCSKLTINTPEGYQRRLSGVFIINFENISHLVSVFLLLNLSR